MEGLGTLQETVWQRIKAAAARGDSATLAKLSPIADDMDRKRLEWGRALNGDGVTPSLTIASQRRRPDPGLAMQGDPTGRTIHKVVFGGVATSVSTFKEAFMSVIRALHEKHPDQFDSVVRQISGRKPYFSDKRDDLRIPFRVENSRLFVETNLPARQVFDISYRLVEAFGHRRDELRFELSEVGTLRVRRRRRRHGKDIEEAFNA
ncbi:MAG: hypothetical protein ACHQZS_05445 [Candidatus Binatales bacterium]